MVTWNDKQDAAARLLAETLVGRTIVAVDTSPEGSDLDWVHLTFDDGRRVAIEEWNTYADEAGISIYELGPDSSTSEGVRK